MFKSIKKALQPTVTVAQIHHAFETEVDEILKKILNVKSEAIEKSNILQKLGFHQAKHVTEMSSIIQDAKKQQNLRERVNYFQEHYPFNRFITEEVVQIICKKYHLVLGSSNQYKGDIPDKNINEIKNFKLRTEDHEAHRNTWVSYRDHSSMIVYNGVSGYNSPYEEHYEKREHARWGYLDTENTGMGSLNWRFITAIEGEEFSYSKEGFKICAPLKDMQLSGRERIAADGYTIEVHDPVVLQPVQGGYLIVSKWGEEAGDENVVNSIEN